MCRDARLGARLGVLVVVSAGLANAAPPPPPLPNDDVVVRGVRPKEETWDARFGGPEAAGTAGAEGDPAKIVEDLPGVAHASLGADPLVLWGSSSSDTRILVDGVEIPSLFHGGALRSTIDGDLVGALTLTPGAYGAGYGRALGGLVRIDTRELPRDGWHGALDVNVLDSSAWVGAPVGERTRIAAGGRVGYLDRTLPAVGVDHANDVFPIPSYGDYFAKAQMDLRAGESLDALLLGSHDSTTTTANEEDPAHVLESATRTGFERLSLRYRRTLGDGAHVEVTPWVGRDVNTYDAHFGANPERLDEHDVRWGLRAEERAPVARTVTVALGMDATGTHAALERRGSLTLPPREGDVTVFGQGPGSDSSSDRFDAAIVDVAPYASLDWALGPVNVEPALRVDGYLVDASRKTPRVGQTPSIGASSLVAYVEPRLSVRARLSSRVTVLASAGLYSEPPAPADLGAVFGTPTLHASSGEHASVGEAVELSRTLSATLTGFYKWMSGLPVRDPSAIEELAHALVGNGVGRSYGVQFLLRQKPWHGFSGFLAYTLSRSERRDTTGGAFRLFDEDEPEVVTVAANQVLGAYTLGIRVRYASGQPRTPVIGTFYDEKDDVTEPVFGAQNSLRLPAFFQLDVRAARRFVLPGDMTLSVYAEALNVIDRRNADDYVYDTRYARRGTISNIPILGVVGVRVER